MGCRGGLLVRGGLLETRDSTQYTKKHSIAPPTAKNDLQAWPLSKAGADGVFPELPKAEAKSKWVEKTGPILLLVEGREGGQKSLRRHWGTRNGKGGETG